MAHKKMKPVVRQKSGCVRKGACAPQWLRECASDMPRAMLCGNGYLALENCGQVTRFDTGKICIETSHGLWTVTGTQLDISRENEHTAIIRGKISALAIENA